MKEEELLLNIGFNKKEAKIYLACLQSGPLAAGEIARSTGIQRTYIYDLTRLMVERGVLEQTMRNKRRMFQSVSPTHLIKMQEEKSKLLKDNLAAFQALENDQEKRPRISYYEGLAGLEEVSHRVHFDGGTVRVFTDDFFYTLQVGRYQKRHIDRRTTTNTFLQSLSSVSTEALASQKRDKEELRETRLFPKRLLSPQAMIGTYHDKVFVHNHKKQFGYIIEDKQLAETLVQIFDLLWESGKIVDR